MISRIDLSLFRIDLQPHFLPLLEFLTLLYHYEVTLYYLIETSNMKNCIVLWLEPSDLKGQFITLDSSLVGWLAATLRMENCAVKNQSKIVLVLRCLPKIENFRC
jgi:hypothetical protein